MATHPGLIDPADVRDHIIGPAHARVTLVEYGDFECPNCKQAAPVVKLLMQRFGGQIRFVYRHFPLEEVHPHALLAAEAAEAAANQGKFWPMHDVLFDNQSHLKLRQLVGYAEELAQRRPRDAHVFPESSDLRRILRRAAARAGDRGRAIAVTPIRADAILHGIRRDRYRSRTGWPGARRSTR
jgi:thiol-disulfide isomerase/thioredoxin